jgi:hypothetical protein
MEIRAVLLTTSIDEADAEFLRAQGVDVRTAPRRALSELAVSSLEIRKEHPRLPLIVSASERQLRRFEKRYPALVDIPIPKATAGQVLAALG